MNKLLFLSNPDVIQSKFKCIFRKWSEILCWHGECQHKLTNQTTCPIKDFSLATPAAVTSTIKLTKIAFLIISGLPYKYFFNITVIQDSSQLAKLAIPPKFSSSIHSTICKTLRKSKVLAMIFLPKSASKSRAYPGRILFLNVFPL